MHERENHPNSACVRRFVPVRLPLFVVLYNFESMYFEVLRFPLSLSFRVHVCPWRGSILGIEQEYASGREHCVASPVEEGMEQRSFVTLLSLLMMKDATSKYFVYSTIRSTPEYMIFIEN